tara:strand:- start:121 stop:387 length:267 start_codon:yes stop_codon:yes gene_type:complete
MNKYQKDREELYNEVIQEYSELTYFPKRDKFNRHYDDVQNVVSNLVDLVENYGDDVYKVITLLDYDWNHLLDYEYLETQMINHIQNTN